MTTPQLLLLGALVLAVCLCCAFGGAPAEPGKGRLVRLAELEIDPAQLDSYKVALKEEIEASIRLEPGVPTLFAVSVKGHPNQIRIFETYADVAAYEAHLETPHFRKYKTGTQRMVKSLTVVETDTILLGAKSTGNLRGKAPASRGWRDGSCDSDISGPTLAGVWSVVPAIM